MAAGVAGNVVHAGDRRHVDSPGSHVAGSVHCVNVEKPHRPIQRQPTKALAFILRAVIGDHPGTHHGGEIVVLHQKGPVTGLTS